MSAFSVGRLRIQCLQDGAAPFAEGPLPASFPGVSVADFEPFRSRYPATFVGDTWLVQFCGILIQTPDRNIVIDTGLGRHPDPYWGVPEGRLGRSLEAAGLAVEDIDTVLLTHLHADHVGWNMAPDGQPTFPQATYIVQQADWIAFREPPLDRAFPFEYLERDVYALESSGRLLLMDGAHRICDELDAVPAPGHTPGHVVVHAHSEGEEALYVGDAILHPAQVAHPEWPFVFDLDRERASSTRRELVEWAERDGMRLMACHFPDPHVGQVTREGNLHSWVPSP